VLNDQASLFDNVAGTDPYVYFTSPPGTFDSIFAKVIDRIQNDLGSYWLYDLSFEVWCSLKSIFTTGDTN